MPLAGSGCGSGCEDAQADEDPSAGANEGSGGKLAGSGTAPRLAPELPEVGGGDNRKVTTGQACPGRAHARIIGGRPVVLARAARVHVHARLLVCAVKCHTSWFSQAKNDT